MLLASVPGPGCLPAGTQGVSLALIRDLAGTHLQTAGWFDVALVSGLRPVARHACSGLTLLKAQHLTRRQLHHQLTAQKVHVAIGWHILTWVLSLSSFIREHRTDVAQLQMAAGGIADCMPRQDCDMPLWALLQADRPGTGKHAASDD